jgi:non-heme chloroperoxidase
LIADRYRAIACSRRNHFPNETSPEGMPDGAADAHGENLAAFVRAIGLSRTRVVAHSAGARAALFFAAAHPELVVSLALNEPPATGIPAGVPGAADIDTPKKLPRRGIEVACDGRERATLSVVITRACR